MTWIDVPKTFTVRPFSVGHTTSMIDLPQMSSGGLLPTGYPLFRQTGIGFSWSVISMKTMMQVFQDFEP